MYKFTISSKIRKTNLQARNPFQIDFAVGADDIDDMGHVNNVVYVRWVQEVAAAHWNHAAPLSLREKYAWVVLRHEIDYKNPAFLKDNITGRTWVGDYHGARFDRFVTITRDAVVLAEAKTTWCLLDAFRMRPIRIPPEIIDLL